MLKELLYGLLPYSLNKSLVNRRCGFHKQDKVLQESRIVLSPPDFDFGRVVSSELDKSVSFLPYCAKPRGENGCPLCDPVHGRKDSKCLKLMDMDCHVPCTLGSMVDILKKHGFTRDRIFIIDSDPNLFSWLKDKKEEGYKYIMPGVACHYGVGYALNHISKKLGYSGCIVFLDDHDPKDSKNGVCRGISDYLSMEKYDKGKLTRITESSISTIDMMLAGNYKSVNNKNKSYEVLNYPNFAHDPSEKTKKPAEN
ncbi:hypothetical protein Mzhil_0295 [Methanosalsum zhilinae DSM 4017]|uniref:Uncharacterized protein n=1 Tax=Methanosalsum zhilinae (strain DSM 4017 / NBRC 107636 / OCM 62 / WeN5) TaxID=679901 RepID=F7XNY1_METZD|nr:hypothetical protein [Methanosalsum zhilinae]AEH60171.1 hypothetical protein Mzhil_0295 [Methanosalsum zhilinae DSM 4017]